MTARMSAVRVTTSHVRFRQNVFCQSTSYTTGKASSPALKVFEVR
jgi:hypothetical protein